MIGLIDIQMEVVKEFEKFRENYKKYGKIIKEIAKEVFGENFS